MAAILGLTPLVVIGCMTFVSDEGSPQEAAPSEGRPEAAASEEQPGVAPALAAHTQGALSTAVARSTAQARCTDADRWYRATIAHEDSEIPFFLALPPASCRTGQGRIVNGSETVTVRTQKAGSRLTLEFPLYHSRIELAATASGVLEGHWDSEAPIATPASLSIRARPIDEPDPRVRFEGAAAHDASSVKLAGDWKVTFQGSGTGKLSLEQPLPGVVTGVVHFPTGDTQYLAGNVVGNQLRLSRFNGVSPYLLVAEIRDSRKLEGTWLAGQNLDWREELTARRTRRIDVAASVELKRGHTTLKLPELDSERYKGRPVIVEFAASWCTACSNASPVLRDIYARHRAQGLEIVTYTYEFTDDDDYNRRQAELFKKLHDLSWEMIPVKGTLDDYWNIVPSEIEAFDELSFPITFFINPDGSVQGAQAGFPPPVAQDDYQRSTDTYRRLTAEILANHAATGRSGDDSAVLARR